MCGIAGLVDFRKKAPPTAVLDAMCRAMAHRGPDDHGVMVRGPCGLAQARLSIIDLALSIQPMDLPGGMALTFNGEIYNYPKLRAALEARGHSFKTNGDTEVLLHMLAEQWTDALPQLDAMFAFAAWDPDKRRALLARDPLGEKPLFYANPAPGLLIFGSEPKALLEHPEVNGQLHLGALRQALRFRAVYGAQSLQAGVRQLAPGHYLEFDEQGLRTAPFYDQLGDAARLRPTLRAKSEAELIAEGEALFMQSVEERLIADVPVGSFLSGGLDSSMIAAAVCKLRPGATLETFSVGFADDPHSELPFAQMVADALGTRHRAIAVGPDQFITHMAELSHFRDGPVSEPADVAIAEMSRIARQTVKVALSGEGADEVFAGYPKYALANVPPVVGLGVRAVGAERAATMASWLGVNRARVLIATRALSQSSPLGQIAQWFSNFDRPDLARLFPDIGWSDAEWAETLDVQRATLKAAGGAESPLFRMQAVDCASWLPGNMLERGDRMSMARGLEVRPPFLDKELVAFGLALPDRMKVRGGVGKWIVRRWADDLLPAEIVQRKKWGFRVPLAQWFRGPLKTYLTDYLTRSGGLGATYGDPVAIRRLLDEHQSGAIDASTSLWTLLGAEVWYQDVYLPRTAAPSKRAQAELA